MSNIQPYIIINGVNSRTISGLLITSLPPISKPQQRTQVETVDGRSGDIVTPLGFAAYDKPIKIGLTRNYDIDEVIEFFNTSGTVIFSNEPTKYYRFAIYEQIDFEKLIRFKTAEVVLHVQPYKFSTTEEPLLFNDPTEISVENNGNTDARPNLLITGSGEIDVSLNGSQLLSMDLGEDDQTVIIDSEDMNAYGAQSAIREVVADIEPKQDLHGYDKPWVGGAGKNLLPLTVDGIKAKNQGTWSGNSFTTNGITFTIQTDNDNNVIGITATGTATGGHASLVIPVPTSIVGGTSVTLNGNPSQSSVITRIWVGTRSYADISADIGSGATFDYSDSVAFIWIQVLKNNTINNIVFKPMIRLATETDPTFEPYSNVCHINGFTEANISLNETIYNIAFTDGDDPLTVYGGELNVTTGLLEVNKIIKVGFTRGNIDSSGKLYSLGAPANILTWESSQTSAPGLLTNCFETVGLEVARRLNSGQVAQLGKTLWISGYVGKEDKLNAILPNLQIVYSIAEPYTVQLTPTQINNLLGLNNLYSDTGDLSVKYKSGGVIQTQTGDIVTFTVGVGDMDKGTLLNRLITGNYDKIRLKKGENVISFTGNVKQVSIDKYSRWI
jgi:phage-related protein